MPVRVAVVVFPGSNCDRDMFHVLADVFGFDVQYCWHEDGLPGDTEAIVLPGGFSYGDRLRAGVIAASSPVMSDVKKMADTGTPVLGVCNGFQILTEAGLLPGVLLGNDSAEFMCRWTRLIVENCDTPFTGMLDMHQKIPVPVANGEGRYYADEQTIRTMEENGQVVFRYEDVLNGSTGRIAGVCNKRGNIVGMMPHPERAAESAINPHDSGPASLIFKSLLSNMGARR